MIASRDIPMIISNVTLSPHSLGRDSWTRGLVYKTGKQICGRAGAKMSEHFYLWLSLQCFRHVEVVSRKSWAFRSQILSPKIWVHLCLLRFWKGIRDNHPCAKSRNGPQNSPDIARDLPDTTSIYVLSPAFMDFWSGAPARPQPCHRSLQWFPKQFSNLKYEPKSSWYWSKMHLRRAWNISGPHSKPLGL